MPLSQGWRHGDYVWVGGQISADKRGRAVHQGDLVAQTEAVMRHIFSVLAEGGATPEQLLHLKVCYLHDGDAEGAEARLATIMQTVRAACGVAAPAITAFGVDLLYEGLLLEIDAFAIVNSDRTDVAAQNENANWIASHAGIRRGRYCQVSGQSPRSAASASLAEKVHSAVERCQEVVIELGGSTKNVARLTVLLADESGADAFDDRVRQVQQSIEALWPSGPSPAVSIVRVEGLPAAAAVQIDAFAIIEDPSSEQEATIARTQ